LFVFATTICRLTGPRRFPPPNHATGFEIVLRKGKMVEDYRSPRRYRVASTRWIGTSFWSAKTESSESPLSDLIRSETEMIGDLSPTEAKAVTAPTRHRSPKRFAITEAAGKSTRFWTAPVLWRFGKGREMDGGRNLVLTSSRHEEKQ
jgi:hypothetical protein